MFAKISPQADDNFISLFPYRPADNSALQSGNILRGWAVPIITLWCKISLACVLPNYNVLVELLWHSNTKQIHLKNEIKWLCPNIHTWIPCAPQVRILAKGCKTKGYPNSLMLFYLTSPLAPLMHFLECQTDITKFTGIAQNPFIVVLSFMLLAIKKRINNK